MQQMNDRIDDRIERILKTLEQAERDISNQLSGRGTEVSSASTMNVNAGGVGIWICAWIASICCIAMMVAGSMFFWNVSRQIEQQDAKIAKQDDQLSRMQDYLNAIYMVAPQLKPKDSK